MYTVFPVDYDKRYEASYLPQDFETYDEAVEYAESLDCEFVIEEM